MFHCFIDAILGKMKDIFHEHIFRLCKVNGWKPSVESATAADKILLSVEQICELVESQSLIVAKENKENLQASHFNE
jgi:hypothetical protein